MNELFMLYDRWNGLIILVFGIYACLLAYGYLPRTPKDPERLLEWRRKFGPFMKVLAPILVLSGLVQLVIGLTNEPVNPAARRIFNEFYRANEARSARGASVESAEKFLADLKQIKSAEAPVELRTALADYTSALEDGLRMLRASKPTTDADARMRSAQLRLSELEAKFKP